MQKVRFKINLQMSLNLKNILCKNRDKLTSNRYLGVYELKSLCGSVYNGETKKKIIIKINVLIILCDNRTQEGMPQLF